jgi:inorganic pyrophosphatase
MLSSAVRRLAISREVVGELGSAEFRIFYKENGKRISAWHDITLDPKSQTVPMLCEIPKMTTPKMELATKLELNPIMQDVKKGKLRNYHGPLYWNYGMIPQTFEDPDFKHPQLGLLGDGDPVDVVEIGTKALEMGEVREVILLGALGMIDEGELDWKLIALATDDPLAARVRSLADLEKEGLGCHVSGIREWFRWYKTPDGKPLNAFALDEQALGVADTMAIVQETHEQWRQLRAKGHNKFWTGK